MDGSHTKAYAYFRAAANTAPDFDSPWVNLGILYRRAGYSNLAEMAYERAIEVDSENLTAWENLAFLYAQEGQDTLAQSIMHRVEKRRQDNPFYHFILGEQAFDAGNIDQALVYYRSAYRLDSSRHEVLFGLSKVYYKMGNVDRSVKFMQLAKKHSPNPQDENRYQGKLSKLQQAI
jgi:tetratricopeptide (TPR) repeat protein